MRAIELGLVDTLLHLGIVCYVNAKDSSLKLERTQILLSLPLISFCAEGLFPAQQCLPRKFSENKPNKCVLVLVARRHLIGLLSGYCQKQLWWGEGHALRPALG